MGSVLIGSMNWGSSAALRNREMGVLIHGQELASEYLQSFDEDWSRLDTNTDSDGDLLPDMWEIQYGLNRIRSNTWNRSKRAITRFRRRWFE